MRTFILNIFRLLRSPEVAEEFTKSIPEDLVSCLEILRAVRACSEGDSPLYQVSGRGNQHSFTVVRSVRALPDCTFSSSLVYKTNRIKSILVLDNVKRAHKNSSYKARKYINVMFFVKFHVKFGVIPA